MFGDHPADFLVPPEKVALNGKTGAETDFIYFPANEINQAAAEQSRLSAVKGEINVTDIAVFDKFLELSRDM
ncbi:MAG: hypothetical protein GY868_08835 [Deltaproteobacteria bacterium]|nr:hypothetical protein [Deltaproteobacteria bacterium]